MTQNSTTGELLRRVTGGAVVGAAVASGLVFGVAPVASAQPADSNGTSQTEQQRPVSPDQVLMMISEQYQTGRGGGQVSKLIEQVMTLRQRGIRPSMANTQALLVGLEARPNQGPLIEALQSTVAYQRKVMAQAANGGAAAGPPGPATRPGQQMGPNWGPGNPMQQDGDTIFPMPGR
ncbi:hypothetical protein [Mycolicibacterium sp.]|uniref:hypothetical protein n=1 Tax=Mycolicibacterium sp. TaxID=2320850 RepID=UPI003D0D16E7